MIWFIVINNFINGKSRFKSPMSLILSLLFKSRGRNVLEINTVSFCDFEFVPIHNFNVRSNRMYLVHDGFFLRLLFLWLVLPRLIFQSDVTSVACEIFVCERFAARCEKKKKTKTCFPLMAVVHELKKKIRKTQIWLFNDFFHVTKWKTRKHVYVPTRATSCRMHA